MQQNSTNGFNRAGHMKDVTARLLRRGRATITALGLLTVSALIAGCGGGGSSGDGAGTSPAVVSGVAATGSPLAGGRVFLKDSSSVQRESDIDATTGFFSINVDNMKGPFVLKATRTTDDGLTRTMFSFAATPGTANVNPFSSVALANAAGVDDPATVFDNSDPATLEKVRIAMPDSIGKLRSKLQPVLGAFGAGSDDPVSGPFVANHDGLDAVFDNVKVVLSNGIVTITNVNTGAVLFTAEVKRNFEDGDFNDNDKDRPKPGGNRPGVPTNVLAVGGDAQVTISWDPVAGATSYDLFFGTRSNVAEREDHDDGHGNSGSGNSGSGNSGSGNSGSGNSGSNNSGPGNGDRGDNQGQNTQRVRNVTSPFVLKPLAANTTYFLTLRASINGNRGAPSAEVSATTSAVTPVVTIPAAPVGVTASGGTRSVTISWPAVSGATSFNLYWSTTAGVTIANGTKITGVTSPFVQFGLLDSTTYFYVVTAVNSAGESAASAQAQATTLAFVPTTTTTSTTGATTTSTGATTTSTSGPTTSSTAPTTTSTSTTTTTSTTASTTTTTLGALPGVALFAANCSGCHGALATTPKRGATVTRITNAIDANTGGMGFLSTLTTPQIANIAAALL